MTSTMWADDPAKSVSEDRFGRAPFARLVADTINQLESPASSTVFGLVGQWGSGKSSVVHMVAEYLPADWQVQYFNPWATSSAIDLQAEFLATLDAALGGKGAEEAGAKKALREYASTLTPLLGLVPGGAAVRDTAEKAIDHLTRPRPWSAEFKEMSESLEKLGRRVLIVCDDIDRLDANELLAFLKVVRLLGRFPNVHYLIAYDAATVNHLLTGHGAASPTSSFMEKIVQHPFELPSVDAATRFGHVYGAVDRAIRDHEAKLNESGQRRLVALVDALVEGLHTPRQISRFEQHLVAIRKMVPGEVDILDFAAVAYLRLNHHEIYRSLPEWSHELRAGDPAITGQLSVQERRKQPDTVDGELRYSDKWLGRLVEIDRSGHARAAWTVLKYLYPNLTRNGIKEPREQGFADAVYEERYFSLGVPANDVSDVLVQRAMRSLAAVEDDKAAEAELTQIVLRRHESVGRLGIRKARQAQGLLFEDDTNRLRLVGFLDSLTTELRIAGQKSALREAVDAWLAAELFEAYSAGQIDRPAIIDRVGEDRAIENLLRLSSRYTRRSDQAFLDYLNDFVDNHFSQVGERLRKRDGDLAKLRSQLLLVARARGREAITGLFDEVVKEDFELLADIAEGMVYTENWYDGVSTTPELSFDEDLWTTVLGEEVRHQLASVTQPYASIDSIDEHNTSSANRRLFGIASARHQQLKLRGD